MINPNLDHIGLVALQVEPVMEQLSAHLGVDWRGVFERKIPVDDSARGKFIVDFKIAVTTQYPYLEVIQAVPHSPWALDEDRIVLHHLAYFAEDLAEDSSRIAEPCPIEIAGVGPDGKIPRTFTYQVLNGLRFEVLERRS
jgi:hypothetical protein